jgi:hypothetical protein
MPRGGKPVSRLRAEHKPHVQTNARSTEKLRGGITGKGFLPGRSGNPGGGRKKRPITDTLLHVGALPIPERWRKKLSLWAGATWFDGVAMAMFQEAAKGDPAAAKEIREAIEGKAPQRIELDADVDFKFGDHAREKLLDKLAPEANLVATDRLQ